MDHPPQSLAPHAPRTHGAGAPQPLPLLCSVAAVARAVAGEATRIDVRVAPDCPPCLADPDALEEALTALVILMLEDGPARLSLTAAPVADEAQAPRVAVRLAVDCGVLAGLRAHRRGRHSAAAASLRAVAAACGGHFHWNASATTAPGMTLELPTASPPASCRDRLGDARPVASSGRCAAPSPRDGARLPCIDGFGVVEPACGSESACNARCGPGAALERRQRSLAAALRRVEQGRYARCEACGAPLDPRRLQGTPDARCCAPCEHALRVRALAQRAPAAAGQLPSPD